MEQAEYTEKIRNIREKQAKHKAVMVAIKDSGSLPPAQARLLALAITHLEESQYRLSELLDD